jgi:hypothetical protein
LCSALQGRERPIRTGDRRAGRYGFDGARFSSIASTGGVTIAVSSDIATMMARTSSFSASSAL